MRLTLPDSTVAGFDANDCDAVVERVTGNECSSATDEVVIESALGCGL